MSLAGTLAHHGHPSTQTRFDRVKVIAETRLRHLFEQSVNIPEKQRVEGAVAAKELANRGCLGDINIGLSLDQQLVKHFRSAQCDADPGQPFAANVCDLDGVAGLSYRQERDHAAVREI